jgi:hypothetical protein
MFGVPYWSLSQWAKLKVKNAVNYIGAFEQTLAGEARRHGADGVICGHIHYATIRDEHGIRYMNCGDWVKAAPRSSSTRTEGSRSSPGPIRCEVRAGSPRCGARRMTRILVATDAWHPQVNGVVRTLAATAEAARVLGVDVSFLTPQSFAPSRCRVIPTCGWLCRFPAGSRN